MLARNIKAIEVALATVLFLTVIFCSGASASLANVTVDFSRILATSRTATTYQIVSNPLIDPRYSPIAGKIIKNAGALKADLVRYAAWYPYPKVGVAELDPPGNGTTSWNFSSIEAQLFPVMAAIQEVGYDVLMEFCTQPTWMYNTTDWSYPQSPSAVDWSYPRGTPTATTTTLLAQYYGRLASYFIRGQFTDEFGKVIKGKKKWDIQNWEIFNEPDLGCHGFTAEIYTQQYDAIVKEIRRVADPEKKIKFFGLALAGRNIEWIQYFLDPKNHDSEVELDYITFHFYGVADRMNVTGYEIFFTQADELFPVAKQIFSIRDTLNPKVKIDMNEVGTILNHDNDPNAPLFPPIYWDASASLFVYVWGNLVDLGLDVIGMSQLAGSPPIPQWGIPDAQFPSVSMVNWTTGEGNQRFQTLKLVLEKFGPGDAVAYSYSNSRDIYAKAIISGQDSRQRLVLVNKRNVKNLVIVPSQFKTLTVIDETTQWQPPKVLQIQNSQVTLLPFGWGILE